MLPYLLPCWVLGVLLSFVLPWLPDGYTVAAGAAVLLCAVRRWPAAWLALAVLAGAVYGVWRTQAALAAQWQSPRSEVVWMRVDGLPQYGEQRVQFTAEVRDGNGRQYRARVADYALRDWPAGSVWQVRLALKPPVAERNLRGFDREAWALAQGMEVLATAGRERQALAAEGGISDGLLHLRSRISAGWQEAGGGQAVRGAALMRALGIGEQGALDAESWALLRPLGLNHLVSISGAHVGMVALSAAWASAYLLRLLPFVPRRPRFWQASAGVAAAVLYAALAGFAVPTVRTVWMLAVLAAGWWYGGVRSVWRAWWWALALVLLWQPAAALAAGTWLSFGLTAALLWAASWRLEEKRSGAVWQAQWAAAVASLVAVGVWFGLLPLLSPVANLLAVPWFTVVLVPLALAGSLLPLPWLREWAVWTGEATVWVLERAAAYAPEWPLAAAPWPLSAVAVCAVAVWLLPKGAGLRVWAWLVLAAFVSYRPPPVPEGRVQAVVLDVGQGLAVWLQTARHHVLFDTGTAGAAQLQLLPALRAAGVRRLDMLVLSHHDADHDGGFQAVRDAFRPSEIRAGQPQFYPDARSCRQGGYLMWDGVRFEWLALPLAAGSDNAYSCVLRVVAGGEALLLTGDLDSSGEAALAAHYGNSLYSQVLVLGHHGSSGSSSGVFLNAVAPQWAVASSGYANPYRHPTETVQTRLSAHGIRLLRTDTDGAWRFVLGDGETVPEHWAGRPFYWQKKPFGRADGPDRQNGRHSSDR